MKILKKLWENVGKKSLKIGLKWIGLYPLCRVLKLTYDIILYFYNFIYSFFNKIFRLKSVSNIRSLIILNYSGMVIMTSINITFLQKNCIPWWNFILHLIFLWFTSFTFVIGNIFLALLKIYCSFPNYCHFLFLLWIVVGSIFGYLT